MLLLLSFPSSARDDPAASDRLEFEPFYSPPQSLQFRAGVDKTRLYVNAPQPRRVHLAAHSIYTAVDLAVDVVSRRMPRRLTSNDCFGTQGLDRYAAYQRPGSERWRTMLIEAYPSVTPIKAISGDPTCTSTSYCPRTGRNFQRRLFVPVS